MIQESFIFLPKIGKKREQQLWENGLFNWDCFLKTDSIKGINKQRKKQFDQTLTLWKLNHQKENHRFFYFHLPLSEHFRLYHLFQDDILYVDIETTEYYGDITVVGLYNGDETITLVQGHNLCPHYLKHILDKHKLLVTYNGSSFDIPILERFLGEKICMPHIDLRHVCAKIGLQAPLKVVEKILNIKRGDYVDGLAGEDAVSLWYLWKTTKKETYLEKLIAYNREDIVNLEPIAQYAIPRLWKKIRESV